ncbi:MAG TPA: sulfurtransferase [Acidimicrobiia bacterium]|nr:sulfurtransferase [Acidimicrobiia bacterium]
MPLISTSELAARVGTRGLRVFDVRADLADPAEGRRRYDRGHLPDAVFVALEADLTGRSGPGRHPLPRPEEFSAAVRRFGVNTGDSVVAYDDTGGAWASRLWWMLRSMGHVDVSVLDGGFPKWAEEGRPVTRAIPRTIPGSFPTVREWRGVVDRSVVTGSEARLIDARAPERYRGDHEPIDQVAGHIPGAVNLPYDGNLRADGTFLDAPTLARRFKGVGSAPIVYCGSGVSACHNILAMHIAGRDDALLYEGSWSDWSRQQGAPVATGDE